MLTFYLHFNRNAVKQGDPKVWSIRTSKGCFHASQVIVNVPVKTIYKTKGPQPRAFLKGKGNGYVIEMKDGTEAFLLCTDPYDHSNWSIGLWKS